MNRTIVALLAALEALVIAIVGLAVVLLPLTVLWMAQYHLAVDWGVFARAGADIWLLGHGVDFTVTLDAATLGSLGVTGAVAAFPVTIAAGGIALLVALAGTRIGLRASATAFPRTALAAAAVCYAVVGTAVAAVAGSSALRPSLWQSAVLPALVLGAGVVIGLALGRGRSAGMPGQELPSGALATGERDPRPSAGSSGRLAVIAALRGGSAAALLLLGASAVVVTVLVLLHFGTIVGLYETLHTGIVGGFLLTVGQLAFLPNLVVWVGSWLVGPGVAIGTGSSVSPLGTQLGPIPTVPLLGVLPTGQVGLGFLGLAVPVAAAFVAGLLLRRTLNRPADRAPALGMNGRAVRPGLGTRALIAVGAAIVAGVELGLLAWWSSGAVGPGRLQQTGPNPWAVAAWTAAEVAVPVFLGLLGNPRRGADAEPERITEVAHR